MNKRDEYREYKRRQIKELNGYIKDENKCKNIINRFNRINALEHRLILMDNNERYHTNPRLSEYLQEEYDKSSRMLYRINEELDPYGLRVYCANGYAKIVLLDTSKKGFCIKRDVYYGGY